MIASSRQAKARVGRSGLKTANPRLHPDDERILQVAISFQSSHQHCQKNAIKETHIRNQKKKGDQFQNFHFDILTEPYPSMISFFVIIHLVLIYIHLYCSLSPSSTTNITEKILFSPVFAHQPFGDISPPVLFSCRC